MLVSEGQHVAGGAGQTEQERISVVVPMFSIRSDEDLGVGEFLDLKLLVDWAVNLGFHLVQLLPINDTSVHGMRWDPYPYSLTNLFLKLSEAATYARKKNVILKGDLPIGVDRNSVDTWVYPTLFRMNTTTGAPLDYFDKNGQNWGFPTYNWEEMSKDNYGWWRARLTQGGAVSLKEATVPTPRLISSQELEFFRPHIEIKRDRQTSEVFEVLDAEGPYRSTREQLFSIGQMLRIRKGPLKGYLCRVVRIFRNDVTVKLDSLLKIVTVQADLLLVPANRGPKYGITSSLPY
ncbi:4-alpha-glucanotransferase DPE2 [Zea mays]|uniref:4-alpha-glucanotransferase n=1 Tax=Zea mays TaxID=4577 RepID=A0A317YFT0_MAIZE|nr:4-alpha-glucanotransferase DPE2 [Zea mays]